MIRLKEETQGQHTIESLTKLFDRMEEISWSAPTIESCGKSMYSVYQIMNFVVEQVTFDSDSIQKLALRMYRLLGNVVDILPASLMAWEKLATHIEKYYSHNITMLHRAIDSMDRVLTMDSKRSTAWLTLSILEFRVGNVRAAHECLLALSPMVPKSSIVQDTDDASVRRKLLHNLDVNLLAKLMTQICVEGDDDDGDDELKTWGSRAWACKCCSVCV